MNGIDLAMVAAMAREVCPSAPTSPSRPPVAWTEPKRQMKGTRIFAIGALLLLLFSCRGPEHLVAKSAGESEVAGELDKLLAGLERKLVLTDQLIRIARANDGTDDALLAEFRKSKANFAEASSRDQDGLISKKKMREVLAADKSLTRIVGSLESSASSGSYTSNRSYADIMAQMEGLENRMKLIRADYNDALRRNRRYVKLPTVECSGVKLLPGTRAWSDKYRTDRSMPLAVDQGATKRMNQGIRLRTTLALRQRFIGTATLNSMWCNGVLWMTSKLVA